MADGRRCGCRGWPADALRPLGAHLHGQSENLRRYVDGQLLIAAQGTSTHANALTARPRASHPPRSGVAHVRGGIGKLAETLVDAVRRQGGQVLLRQRVTRIEATGEAKLVETDKNRRFEADAVVLNLPPWDAAALLGEAAPARIRKAALPADGWGAFTCLCRPGLGASCQPIFRCTTRSWSGSRSAKGTAFFFRSACPTMPHHAPKATCADCQHTHRPATVVALLEAIRYRLRGAQGGVCRACAGRVREVAMPGSAYGRPARAARHAGHFPAFHAAQPAAGWAASRRPTCSEPGRRNWVTASGWSATASSPASRCWRPRWAGHGSRMRCWGSIPRRTVVPAWVLPTSDEQPVTSDYGESDKS